MTNNSKRIALIAFICLTMFATGSSAGEIHPDLQQLLDAASADDQLGVIVMMKHEADIPALMDYFRSVKSTRQERNEAVITELMNAAQSTQPKIMTALQRQKDAGTTSSIKQFWIVNAIALKANPAAIRELAARDDVGLISEDYPIEIIKPVKEGPPRKLPAVDADTIEPGIVVTGAPELWAMGIDGSGALVCDMDTGADGTHPAFADRWRGLDPGVHYSAAWFDPVTHTTFPFDSGSHGTHTMGTILGKDGNHYIGMAPGAKWIAAAAIDYGDTVSNALATMQWTTDPDGNPSTVDDVPDVTNNSWGIPGTNCKDTFWTALDNAEAAGTVYIWAAGNEGPSSGSLRSPADRTATAVNSFAVGALKQGGEKIANFSSRGPSDCPGGDIKPEVSAVGEDVLSSVPGGRYSEKSGTSMAAPHVSGLVALLRSAYPDATVEDIKYAIYNNTVDLGDPGEDNTYGTGRINAVEALGELGFLDRGGLKGKVTHKESGDPLLGTTIFVEEMDLEQEVGPDGSYRFLLGEPGTYTVTAYHPELGSYEKTAEVEIGPWTIVDFVISDAPDPDFVAENEHLCLGQPAKFYNTSRGRIIFYYWAFGDGGSSTIEDPQHGYIAAGTYTVSLYASGPTGEATKEVKDMIHVYIEPVADFSASKTEIKQGDKVEFTDLSTGPGAQWLWDFGDGNTSEEQNPSHVYEDPGTFTVNLVTINNCGQHSVSKEGYIKVAESGDDDDDDDCGGL